MENLLYLLSFVPNEGESKKGGFILDDGKEYDFRVYNDKGVFHIVIEHPWSAQPPIAPSS